MLEELIINLCNDYEIEEVEVLDIIRLILTSKGVNEDNFGIILETAISHYSSSMPLKSDFINKRVSPIKSVEYALNLEIYNNYIDDEESVKTR